MKRGDLVEIHWVDITEDSVGTPKDSKLCVELMSLLVVLGLHCWVGFSLAAASRGCSLVAVEGFLTVVASLIVEHGLRAQAQ